MKRRGFLGSLFALPFAAKVIEPVEDSKFLSFLPSGQVSNMPMLTPNEIRDRVINMEPLQLSISRDTLSRYITVKSRSQGA